MIVRQARADDAVAICDIWNDVIRDTLVTFTTEEKSDAAIAGEIAARGAAFLVVEIAGGVSGFATFSPFRGGPGYAFTMEHSIHVRAAARGLGLGRALMARLEAVARDQGVHSLVAGISGANPGGIAFHAAIGFRETGRLPEAGFKAGRWLDLVLMQKIVAS